MAEKYRGFDAIYIVRPQVERWTEEELEEHQDSLPVAKEELERRRSVCPTCGQPLKEEI